MLELASMPAAKYLKCIMLIPICLAVTGTTTLPTTTSGKSGCMLR